MKMETSRNKAQYILCQQVSGNLVKHIKMASGYFKSYLISKVR
jgi:hypothetical protein